MDLDQPGRSTMPDTTSDTTLPGTSGTVVGVFDDSASAERAVQQLRAAGFAEDQIGYASRHPGDAGADVQASAEPGADEQPKGTPASHLTGEHHGGTREGLVMGGVTGLAFGSIVGAAAALLLPGIGPVIAGGILGAALIGGAAGAVTGGIAGALREWGFSEEEAAYYHGEFEAGRTVVSVHAGSRQQEAATILEQNGAHRVSSTGSAGSSTSV